MSTLDSCFVVSGYRTEGILLYVPLLADKEIRYLVTVVTVVEGTAFIL